MGTTLLADERLEHRRQIRNVLALVRAIVQRTASSATSVADYAAHLVGRLDALARIQNILMRDPTERLDLAELVADEFLSQGIAAENVTAPSPSLMLDREVAASLALALHELATNAIKFGQLHLPSRRIDVRWSALDQPQGWAVLDWREDALPPNVSTLGSPLPGFGFELIRKTLPYEIGARTRIEVLPEGLHCEIMVRTAGAAP